MDSTKEKSSKKENTYDDDDHMFFFFGRTNLKVGCAYAGASAKLCFAYKNPSYNSVGKIKLTFKSLVSKLRFEIFYAKQSFADARA